MTQNQGRPARRTLVEPEPRDDYYSERVIWVAHTTYLKSSVAAFTIIALMSGRILSAGLSVNESIDGTLVCDVLALWRPLIKLRPNHRYFMLTNTLLSHPMKLFHYVKDSVYKCLFPKFVAIKRLRAPITW